MIERREFRRHLCGGVWWADRSVCGFCFLKPFEPSANPARSLQLLEDYPEPRGALPELVYGQHWPTGAPANRIPLSVRFRWHVRAVCRQIRALLPYP